MLFLSTLFISEVSFGQGKWWQREIPTPSANQMINPEYYSIRRELEVSLDEKNDLIERYGQQKLSREQQMQYDYLLFLIDSKMTRLEEQLKGTSMYLESPNFNNSNTNIQTTNQENIQNVITDRSYSNSNPNNNSNASSSSSNTKVLNGGGNNLKAKIQFDELKDYISSRSLSIVQKIRYYEAFIKDWPNTDAANEAKRIIESLDKQLFQKRLEQTAVNNGKMEIYICIRDVYVIDLNTKEVLGILYKNNKVIVIGQDDIYYKIEFRNLKGLVVKSSLIKAK